MNTTSVEFKATDVSVEAVNGHTIQVTANLSSAERGGLMETLGIDLSVEVFGIKYLLDHIGVDDVKKHFGLIEQE